MSLFGTSVSPSDAISEHLVAIWPEYMTAQTKAGTTWADLVASAALAALSDAGYSVARFPTLPAESSTPDSEGNGPLGFSDRHLHFGNSVSDADVFYFGCYGQPGHVFFAPGMRRHYGYDQMVATLPWDKVDGALAPRDGRQEKPQGVAAIHHKDGWTALSFWDRTGDSRGNSSSTFFINAELPFDAALAVAREKFPALFDRFDQAGLAVVQDA